MRRRTCIIFLIASIVVGAAGLYFLSLWPRPYNNPHSKPVIVRRGIPEIPADPLELIGHYFKSDSTTNIDLVLLKSGDYLAEQETDETCGTALGKWSLSATGLVLSPSEEAGTLTGYLRTLDIYKFQSNWILVPAQDRENYEKFGVVESTPLFHFRQEMSYK